MQGKPERNSTACYQSDGLTEIDRDDELEKYIESEFLDFCRKENLDADNLLLAKAFWAGFRKCYSER